MTTRFQEMISRSLYPLLLAAAWPVDFDIERVVIEADVAGGVLGVRYGFFPRMNYRFLGDPWTSGQADRLAAIINERGQ